MQMHSMFPARIIEDAKLINVHMQGGAMGNLTSAVFEGEEMPIRKLALEKQKFWAFNGQVGGYEHLLADWIRYRNRSCFGGCGVTAWHHLPNQKNHSTSDDCLGAG